MKETFIVNADFREGQGKGASRRLRRAGRVPAVLYGGKEPAVALSVSHNEMFHHLETEAFYSHILTLKVGDKEQQAVLKDVQRHPADPILMHFDFLRIFADQEIHMSVPLHFLNQETCLGVKTGGGIVEHHTIQVDVTCLPGNLPEYIEVDLINLDVDQSIHLSDLKLPESVALVELKHGNDAAVASVHLPRVVVEETPVEVEAESVEGAEGEKKEGAEGEKKEGEGEKAKPDEKK